MKTSVWIFQQVQTVWKHLNVIQRQNDGPYNIRKALGWCVVGPVKPQCHNAVSYNRIAVTKADGGKMAGHHFEKKLKNVLD